jgi:hypothetical protein
MRVGGRWNRLPGYELVPVTQSFVADAKFCPVTL